MTIDALPDFITQASNGQAISPFNGRIVEEAAVEVAPLFAEPDKPVYVELEPDNCGRYCLLFTPLDVDAQCSLGNEWVLAVVNFDSVYPISIPNYIDSTYAAEKFTGGNIADATVISCFLKKLSREVAELREGLD